MADARWNIHFRALRLFWPEIRSYDPLPSRRKIDRRWVKINPNVTLGFVGSFSALSGNDSIDNLYPRINSPLGIYLRIFFLSWLAYSRDFESIAWPWLPIAGLIDTDAITLVIFSRSFPRRVGMKLIPEPVKRKIERSFEMFWVWCVMEEMQIIAW